jgi:putative peptidoglycan lipid II flippase
MDKVKLLFNSLFLKDGIYRNIASVIITVFIVKILGFLKEVFIGNIFGMSEDLDIFFILILIPSFFNNVFLGAFKAVVIPNYIFAQKKGNLIFQNNLIFQTIILGAILTLGFFVCSTPINTYLVRNYSNDIASAVFENQNLLLFCIPIWTFSSLLSGLLETRKKFIVSAVYPIITSIVFISFLFFFEPSTGLLIQALVIGSFFELCLLLLFQPIKFNLKDIKLDDPDSIILYKQFIPKLLAGLILGFNPIVDQVFTSELADGAISTLNYGNKLPAFAITILTLGVGNVILPYFARLKGSANELVIKKLNKILISLFIVGSICTLFLIVFGKDLIIILFQKGNFTRQDSENVFLVLVMFSFQIPFYLLSIILVRFLTAFNLNTFTIISSTFMVVINVICNYLFIETYGVSGIALSTSIVVLFGFLMQYIYVLNKFKVKNQII